MGIVYIATIARIGTNLLAFDKQFGRAINRRQIAMEPQCIIVIFPHVLICNEFPCKLGIGITGWGGTIRSSKSSRSSGSSGSRNGRRSNLFPAWTYILVETFFTTFAPIATFTIAPKTTGGIKHVCAVHPDSASLQFRGNIQGKVDILAPDTGSQAITSIVSKRHGLRGRAEGHGDQYGPKDFDLGNGGSWRNIGKKCSRVEVVFRGRGPRGRAHGRDRFNTLGHEALHLIKVHG